MMYAYDQTLLYKARTTLGWLFHAGTHLYGVDLEEVFRRFINSGIARSFELGNPSIVAGRSGNELAYEVVSFADSTVEMMNSDDSCERSKEYWAGYNLAYYQWLRNVTFDKIGDAIKVGDILLMYDKYHEMDEEHFVIEIDRQISLHQDESRLRRLRLYAGLSQAQLAKKADIPVRTIQQYEQKKKDLSHANVEYLVRLSKTLYCDVEDIL